MSFNEFRRLKALKDTGREQQLIADLLLASSHLHELPHGKKQERIGMLSQEIVEILDGEDRASGELMDALVSIADELIEDMGSDLGLIHAYLCHIQHSADGGAYNAKMEEKLADRFKRFASGDVMHTQFLTANRDGGLALNNWGQFMMDRMDERLVLASYQTKEVFDFKQIHSFC